jgi:tripartite-type tricarboxylate transporter receptor subunit TctC
VVLTPLRTPAPVVQQLNREIQASLKDPQVIAKMTNAGMEPFPSASGQEAADYIQQEFRKWGGLIREANIRMTEN